MIFYTSVVSFQMIIKNKKMKIIEKCSQINLVESITSRALRQIKSQAIETKEKYLKRECSWEMSAMMWLVWIYICKYLGFLLFPILMQIC